MGSDLLALVQTIAEEPAMWTPSLRLPETSDRWWTRLRANASYDLWLLSWLPGLGTDLHDHGESAAAFAVVQGTLSEVRVHGNGRPHRYVRNIGSATSLAAGVIHDVSGAGVGPAVSIHAYSPPLRAMNYYAYDESGHLNLVRSALSDAPEQEVVR
jgi:hypothetical protein